MIRLDKYLSDATGLTRSEAGRTIRSGAVTVNGSVVRKPEQKFDENTVSVMLNGSPCRYSRFRYYLLDKPTADDIRMAEYFRNAGHEFVVLANKLDKLKKSEIAPNMERIRQTLDLPEDVTLIPFSAEKGNGRDELVAQILSVCP